MKIHNKKETLLEAIRTAKESNKSIGFIPTMGALHQGHCSLIARAKTENEIVVCSIFVNPIQFNVQQDLEAYPRTLDLDCALLEKYECDIVFAPSVDEMYETSPTEVYEFGSLGDVMEGLQRPGHFNGVATVVKRLFDLISPDRAYFGEKDYQQLAIIRQLVRNYKMPIEIISCPIIRENDGLAMSSRNTRLSENDRKQAPLIHAILEASSKLFEENTPIPLLKTYVYQQFLKHPNFEVEYFEIVDAETLQLTDTVLSEQEVVGCIAVWLGGVRLIDMQHYAR